MSNRQKKILEYGYPLAKQHIGERALFPVWELAALAILILCYIFYDNPQSVSNYNTANVAGPIFLTCILLYSAINSILKSSNNLWTCLFWFRLSVALYFGIGCLVPFFVNDLTRRYLEVFYFASPDEILRLNLLVVISVFTTLAAARATFRLQKPIILPDKQAEKSLIRSALVFTTIGYSVKFLITIPLLLGLLDGAIVSGTLLTLGSFGPIGIFLMTRYAMMRNLTWLLPSVAFVLADISIGVILFSKTDAMYGTLFFVMGLLSIRVSVIKGILAATIVITLFGFIVPITEYGRPEARRLFGENGGTFSQRVELISKYLNQGSNLRGNNGEFQSAYARLSYVNAAAFAMNRFDSGLPGHSLASFWAAPIPRILWRDKPNMTAIGQDFNELALNFRTSSSAPGIFADAYWNFGWWGVPILCLPLGILFALMSRYALRVQLHHRWLLFPVVLLFVRMGFRVDGFIVTDIWGPIFIALVFHHVIVAGESLFAGRYSQKHNFVRSSGI